MLFCVAIILSSSQKPESPRWQTTKYIIWLHRLTEFNQRSERNRTKNGCEKTRLRNESSCFAEKMHGKTLKREKKKCGTEWKKHRTNLSKCAFRLHSKHERNGFKDLFHSEYNFFLFIFVELFELVAVAHPIRFFFIYFTLSLASSQTVFLIGFRFVSSWQ